LKVVKLRETLDDMSGQGIALEMVARTYEAEGDRDLALTTYLEAIRLLEEGRRREELQAAAKEATARASLGIWLGSDRIDEARTQLERATELYEAMGSNHNAALCFYNHAQLEHQAGNRQEALDLALHAWQRNPDLPETADTKENIRELLTELGESPA
jgi:tetratricopeptide (TPR) repeat protein